MAIKRKSYVVWFLVLVVLLAACDSDNDNTPSDATSIPGEGEGNGTPDSDIVANEAMVETVEVLVMESMPIQVDVAISGNLPDGCTTIDTIDSTLDGMDFTVSIVTIRDPLALCTEALVPFEERVSLDVVGLEAGTYNVEVVGRDGIVTQSFELPVDNDVPVEEPTGTPAS